ncbi:hypothetical protein AB0M32_42230 [Streptomyces sp. NPDC051985]|uniref:hypothetical protein n=1 Tax=Streptomyces sp. NPDC051985 TaxID=3155807 RepID=UPI00343FD41F
MRAFDIEVDLSGVEGLEPGLKSVATVFLPDQVGASAPVIVGYPGSGFTRRYFHMETKPGYSEAEHHVAQGYVVVACDHVGIGDSTPCDTFALTIESMAAANHATATEVRNRLTAGTLAPGLAPIAVERFAGIGQSMGGCLLIVQQAVHRTFDGIGLLGWSAIHENMPNPDGGRIVLNEGLPRDMDLRPLASMQTHASKEVGQEEELVRYSMHWHEDDSDLVELSMHNLTADPALAHTMPEWRTAVVPVCCAQMMAKGVVAPEAAAVDVPVLVACGEIDCVPDPHAEPACYPNAPEVQVAVFERMAHMHNFARTRAQLWDRITEFTAALPVAAAPAVSAPRSAVPVAGHGSEAGLPC